MYTFEEEEFIEGRLERVGPGGLEEGSGRGASGLTIIVIVSYEKRGGSGLGKDENGEYFGGRS
jgi:hypothetical protein